ncbi:MAG: energy-coupling factor transporter ATPase [Clostridia bacterium]
MIKCENLTFKYESEEQGKKLILDNITVEIEKGSFVAILGRNGSGKSTLAKHFNAILLPSGGKVYVSGMDTNKEKNVFKIRQKAGMVFQNPDNQIVATTVEEDVAFGLENLGVPYEEMVVRVRNALKIVGMADKAKSEPHLLSGGQKQRVAIASVVAMEPECIVLDEPTAMLDPKGRREVMATIKELNKKQNITVILITHYMEEAVKADRIIVMDKGKIVKDATPREIFSSVRDIEKLGLDVPQVVQLVHRLKEKGVNLGDGILRTKECAAAIERLISEARKID